MSREEDIRKRQKAIYDSIVMGYYGNELSISRLADILSSLNDRIHELEVKQESKNV